MDIKGSFAVTKVRLAHANINYVVLFTDDRVIFVKATGRNLRSIGGETDLARLLESAAGGPTGARLPEGEAGGLVRTDKDNFELLYRHISRIRMRKSTVGHNLARSGVMDVEILGMKRATFDIVKGQDYERCRSVVAAAMPEKLQ